MASYSWPTDLYGYILKGSYRETPPDNTVRSQMDAGPPKLRRRSTANTRKFEITHFFINALVLVFDEFYHNTLSSGSLPFNYRHPRTQAIGEFLFTDVPSYTKIGQGIKIITKMEMLP